jgi:hypothetical protein
MFVELVRLINCLAVSLVFAGMLSVYVHLLLLYM